MQVLRSDRNLGATAATFAGHGSGLTDSIGGLYYQFGSKNPIANTLRSFTVASQSQSFASATKDPSMFVAIAGSDINWSTQDNSGYYMWNDKNVVRNTDGKSIFDPSPIGWRLPVYGTYSNFSTSTATLISSNVSTYTLGTTGTANHYAVGCRNGENSNLSDVGSRALLWVSTPYNTTRGYRFFVSTGSFATSYGIARTTAQPLRSIRE